MRHKRCWKDRLRAVFSFLIVLACYAAQFHAHPEMLGPLLRGALL